MYLGCSFKEYKSYLEEKFKPGMTWNNMGKNGWEIDHIVPLARFDLSKINNQMKAFHYTNTQPLWSIENKVKGKVLTDTILSQKTRLIYAVPESILAIVSNFFPNAKQKSQENH